MTNKETVTGVFDSMFDDIKNEYLDSVGEKYHEGINDVFDDEFKESVINNIIELYEEDEGLSEDDLEPNIHDHIDFEFWKRYSVRFYNNLINTEGVAYDKVNDEWTGLSNDILTSYGVIWDVFQYDYDTSIREIVSDIFVEEINKI